MASRTEDARKRKQTTTIPETVVSSDDDQNKSKARRVSTDASASAAASLQVETPVATTTATTVNASSTGNGESLQCIGKMIQDLFHSDNAKVNAALDALDHLNSDRDKDKIRAVGGCFVLFHLMNKCLDKAIDRFPVRDQVAALNELPELTTLHKTLSVITNLTFNHYESKVGIVAIGGVEAVIKVMKSFPKCPTLQAGACGVLRNLASWNNATGSKRAIESGGIEVLLAAIRNHLDSEFVCEKACLAVASILSGGKESRIGKANAIESGGIEGLFAAMNKHLGSPDVCENACRALAIIVSGSKENIGLLITLGGGAAVAKFRTKWPDNYEVRARVQRLNTLIVAEMKTWS